MDAVPFGGGLPMAPLPPLPVWGFGISRGAALKGNATSGLRADERGHGLYSRRTSPFLDTSAVSQAGRLGGDGHRIDANVGPTSPSKVGPGSALCISQLS